MPRQVISNLLILITYLLTNTNCLQGQVRTRESSDEFYTFSHADILSIQIEDCIKWYLPINSENRQSIESVKLTSIGRFGLMRKARPGIPAHLHTGTDLKRPNNNYIDEPIFPAAKGTVISFRDDGPFAQIIVQHTLEDSSLLWTVYEHIAGIQIKLHDSVDPVQPIARFMTRDELNKYGWQFDHIHFEVMKVKPKPRKPDKRRPFLYYRTYLIHTIMYAT